MSLSFNGFDVQPQLLETKIADRMIFPVGNFVHNTLNVCAGLPGYRIKRSGDFRFGYQHQLGMAGGFRFRGKYPAENRKVFQQRDTGNTADHIGAFDAADDKFFSFIADLNFRFKRRLVEPGCAVAVPAKQTRAGNLDRQYGRFPGNNRSYIQFKLETIGCLGCLRIAVFEREIRFLRQFLAAFQNFSVERGIRNGILLRVEKSGSDTDCRLAAVFRHDGSLCHHFCPASGTEEVQVFAVPFWIEVEEIHTAGVRTVDSCGKSACPVVAVTPARGKEIRTIVVLSALEIHNELPSRFYRVKAVLRADNEVVDCRYANLTVRPADKTMVWDDYEVGTWMTSDGSRFYLWNDQAKIMHTAGFRTLIANWTPLSHDFAIRYNFNPTALHHMGLGRTPEPPEYAKTGNKFLLIRKICLSNPAFLAKTEKEFSDLGKHNRKYGLRFCWMGDEQSITGYGGTPIDFCFSKYCLAELREFIGSKLLKATCDGKEITDLEVYARTGKNDLQSFGIITMNPKAREIRFQFPVSGHIYDALTGSYLGKGDTVNRTLSRMHSALFLVAPERFDKPIVKVSGMTLDIQNKSGNDTVYRIEVISPAGKKLDCYTQKLIAKNGKGQYHIPFALSDAKGDYTVKVIEVISRQHVLAKITL